MFVKIIHIIYLARDDYQKIRIIQAKTVIYTGEPYGIPEGLKSSQVKHWSVDSGVLVLEIK